MGADSLLKQSDLVTLYNTKILPYLRAPESLYKRYATYAQYETAYNNNEIPVGSLVIIDEFTNDSISALQVSYSNSNVNAALNQLNSNFSDVVSGTDAVKHPIFHNTGLTGLQAWEGNTGYRLQLTSGGDISLFSTTDGGQNWTKVKTL